MSSASASKKTRNTNQKARILECLRQHPSGHFSVDEIAARVAEGGAPVGLATIYRYLKQLTDQGLARKYVLPNKEACYQLIENAEACAGHFHLRCNACGHVIHADGGPLDTLDNALRSQFQFQADFSATVIYGFCRNCRRVGEGVAK